MEMEEENSPSNLNSGDINVSKKLTKWFDLPYNVRFMIIEMMDSDTKLAYLLCSDECAAEMPKNLIKRIKVSNYKMEVNFHGESPSDPKRELLFHYDTKDDCCNVMCEKEKVHSFFWFYDEPGGTWDVISNYFRRILKNVLTLEELRLDMDFPYKTTSIKHLEISKYLKLETFRTDLVKCRFLGPTQLYQASDRINITEILLTPLQLQKLKAKRICIESDKITCSYINEYLKRFINGKIHKNVVEIEFQTNLEDKKQFLFDIDVLTEELDMIGKLEEEESISFAIVSKEKNYRIAIVNFYPEWNSFIIYMYPKMVLDHDAIDEYAPAIRQYLGNRL